MAMRKRVTPEKVTPETCCCGKSYRNRGGLSNHYCPAGSRRLCHECASTGKAICPTHQVRVRFLGGAAPIPPRGS
jgi:hypothetical protein